MLGLGLECEILDMRLLEEMRKKLKQTVEKYSTKKLSKVKRVSTAHTRSRIRIYVILIRSYFLSQNFIICGSYCHVSKCAQFDTNVNVILIAYLLL